MFLTDYTLQRKPVHFLESPQSQDLFSHDDFELHCKVRIWSNSGLKLRWRHNGEFVNSAHHNNSTKAGIITSTLQIRNMSVIDEGHYECLVVDGIRRNKDAVMISVSNSAQVRVIGKCKQTVLPMFYLNTK